MFVGKVPSFENPWELQGARLRAFDSLGLPSWPRNSTVHHDAEGAAEAMAKRWLERSQDIPSIDFVGGSLVQRFT